MGKFSVRFFLETQEPAEEPGSIVYENLEFDELDDAITWAKAGNYPFSSFQVMDCFGEILFTNTNKR